MTTSRDWQQISDLVRRAQDGDHEAFRELLQSHRQAVTSTLYACGARSTETAQDLAQEVALRAWTRLSELRDERNFTAWIRRIAANAARDHLRRLAARREESLEAALELESGDDPHAQTERVAEIRLMLAALDREDEEVVSLLVARAEGVSVQELADRVGLSPAALKMRLMRARKRLRKGLEALQP